jgi:hypothetical protein
LESQKTQRQQFEEVNVESVFGDEAMWLGNDVGLDYGGGDYYTDGLEEEGSCECAARLWRDEACIRESEAAEEEAGYRDDGFEPAVGVGDWLAGCAERKEDGVTY